MRKRLTLTATLRPTAQTGRERSSLLIYDSTLAWAGLLLLAIGLVMVYSASIAMAEASAHTGYRPWYFLVRHALFVGAGLVAALVAFQVPVKAWQRIAPWAFALGLLLLVAVLIPGVGKSVNGARRWLPLFIVSVQPSEFVKLAVVLYAASYAVRKAALIHAEQPLKQTLLRGFAPLLAVMVITGSLLVQEPDFGAFVVIVSIAFAILFLGGLDWRLFLGLAMLLERPFAALVAWGIGVWVGVQTFINMGVNMGVLPTKGLTLPFLSFGGSGIVANCVALAILLRIDYENRRLLRGFSA